MDITLTFDLNKTKNDVYKKKLSFLSEENKTTFKNYKKKSTFNNNT